MTVKIVIADDHRIVRTGIRAFLQSQPDIEVVGEAGDGEEALTLACTLHPDVVLLDLNMPRLGGLEALRRVKEDCPDVRVLMLTMYEDTRFFLEALAAGADGYVLKGAEPAELLAAIQTVARGDAYLSPGQAKRVLAEYHRQAHAGHAESGPVGLSSREREILALIAQGLTGREIAERLYLSPHTVERHRANILNKLGLRNRVDLIRFAISHGLTPGA